MKGLFVVILVAAGTLSFTPAFGVEKGAGGRAINGDLTLERAVQTALRQNPNILYQLQAIEGSLGQVIEVRAAALPRVTTSGEFGQEDHRLLERGPAGTETEHRGPNEKSWKVDFVVKQMVYDGGRVRGEIQIARLNRDTTYLQLRDTVDHVIAATRTQFYDVLLNRALITVQEESVALLKEQLKDQQGRAEVGNAPRFNVLRAEVAVSNALPLLILARNNYLIAQFELAGTLGLEASPEGKPSFDCVGQINVPERSLDLRQALQIARERRAFLQVQRKQILIAREQIEVSRAGYKPRLDLTAGYEMRNTRLTDRLDEEVNGSFYGITGSWNIFDGFETYGRIKQARAQLESAKIVFDDSVLRVELEVQRAYANVQTASATIRSQQNSVAQALEAFRLATERLAAGAGTQLELLDARTALSLSRTVEIQARAAYNKALAEFDRVTATDTAYTGMSKDQLFSGTAPKAVPVKKPAPAAPPLRGAARWRGGEDVPVKAPEPAAPMLRGAARWRGGV